jgi:hypothetical protein
MGVARGVVPFDVEFGFELAFAFVGLEMLTLRGIVGVCL